MFGGLNLECDLPDDEVCHLFEAKATKWIVTETCFNSEEMRDGSSHNHVFHSGEVHSSMLKKKTGLSKPCYEKYRRRKEY